MEDKETPALTVRNIAMAANRDTPAAQTGALSDMEHNYCTNLVVHLRDGTPNLVRLLGCPVLPAAIASQIVSACM